MSQYIDREDIEEAPRKREKREKPEIDDVPSQSFGGSVTSDEDFFDIQVRS